MHKSRLAGIVIDCETDDFERDISFWGEALGYDIKRTHDPEDQKYAELETTPDQIKVLLQEVDHPSRVHLDIETDDLEAEVRRLEKLGAKRIAHIKRWWVMEAPSGHRFCVVQPQRADFGSKAKDWA
jgi:predicted enzyme related to lactoylglutathione lyase